MSLTRISKTGDPQLTPTGDGRLTISDPHPDQTAQREKDRDTSGWGEGGDPAVGRRAYVCN